MRIYYSTVIRCLWDFQTNFLGGFKMIVLILVKVMTGANYDAITENEAYNNELSANSFRNSLSHQLDVDCQ